MAAACAAVGRTLRLYPTDWGAAFVHDVQAGEALAVPTVGYYTGTITEVHGRRRNPVEVELREFDPVESHRFGLDLARERLLLEKDEDGWVVLPGRGATKRKVSAPAPSRKRLQSMSKQPTGTR